ncbi:putative Charged multivesicular body protein 2a [Hibiscus syriacus]|uniref:RING-type E3 ubiquitin transferase n=1 Tax=Hibiscus syriacus TaxID=106335 RepID=A0A6A2Z8X4_HIBSY|nr:RING-H2 finger protein ATL52-like [Hibiscus syriacus]KAE8687565.1 putative Charged multivesicular body protein 2a [Hibiscus syriacus]
MGDSDTPGPSSSVSSKSNLPMLYYGLVVVGTATIVLAIYNLIIIRWCTRRHDDSNRRARLAQMAAGRSSENQSRILLSSFKYKKGSGNMGSEDTGGEYECPVCLSNFEDGDEVRQLPRCKHSFHALCIDMWLYSHSDCPLCRASVDPDPSPMCQRQTVNSRENSSGIPVLV